MVIIEFKTLVAEVYLFIYFIYLFMVYLPILSVVQTIRRQLCPVYGALPAFTCIWSPEIVSLLFIFCL
jgi:hypothetical protein